MAITTNPIRRLHGGIYYDELAGTAQDVLTNATLTASGSSSYYNVMGARQVELLIAVTGAVSGTSPTLQFDVAISLVNTLVVSNPTFIADITKDAGASLTGVSTDEILIVNNAIGDYIRVDWTLGGTTPSFGGVFARLVVKK